MRSRRYASTRCTRGAKARACAARSRRRACDTCARARVAAWPDGSKSSALRQWRAVWRSACTDLRSACRAVMTTELRRPEAMAPSTPCRRASRASCVTAALRISSRGQDCCWCCWFCRWWPGMLLALALAPWLVCRRRLAGRDDEEPPEALALVAMALVDAESGGGGGGGRSNWRDVSIVAGICVLWG